MPLKLTMKQEAWKRIREGRSPYSDGREEAGAVPSWYFNSRCLEVLEDNLENSDHRRRGSAAQAMAEIGGLWRHQRNMKNEWAANRLMHKAVVFIAFFAIVPMMSAMAFFVYVAYSIL